MKPFNINSTSKEFDWGFMEVIVLGEKGRGRFQRLIPFHANVDAEFLELGTTRSGFPKIVSSADATGWLAVVSGDGSYSRGTYGSCYVPSASRNYINIISSGDGAFGAAGRIGNWSEFLVSISSPLFIYVEPSGGSKCPPYWYHFGENEVSLIHPNELDLFCEKYGLNSPIDLIDLNEL